MSFETLLVKTELLRALQEQGIKTPTSIQQQAIPLIQEGIDVIGISKTGSGKTLAFSLPLLQQLQPGKGIQALVLVPTRELAVQISQEINKYAKYCVPRFSIATVFGGVGFQPQVESFAHADLVVGTPGRIKDHLQQRTLNFEKISYLVLDEADKMVEMGFIEDVRDILSYMPKEKQVVLFGATIGKEIDQLKRDFMAHPLEVMGELQVQEDLLEQYYYNVQPHEKFSLLVHLLKSEQVHLGIIFCSSRSTVELVTQNLKNQGLHAGMIHGKLSQNRRLQAIEYFNRGRPHLLVASAVASRGLDIKDVSHVFNYDLSADPQEYIHRVGRTARAGERGKAITLLSQKDFGPFGDILQRHRVKVTELQAGDFQRVPFTTRPRFEGRFGGSPRPFSPGSRGNFHRDGNRYEQREGNVSRDRYGSQYSSRPTNRPDRSARFQGFGRR